MAGKKGMWGAYIKPVPADKNGLGPLGGEYVVRIGLFDRALLEPGEMFISNPEISHKIEAINREHAIKSKITTGVVSFFVREPKKEVRIVSVIPFTWHEAELPRGLGERLMHIGLASKIELRVLMDLEKKFPGYNVVPLARSANWLRRMMVHKRGSTANRIKELEGEVF